MTGRTRETRDRAAGRAVAYGGPGRGEPEPSGGRRDRRPRAADSQHGCARRLQIFGPSASTLPRPFFGAISTSHLYTPNQHGMIVPASEAGHGFPDAVRSRRPARNTTGSSDRRPSVTGGREPERRYAEVTRSGSFASGDGGRTPAPGAITTQDGQPPSSIIRSSILRINAQSGIGSWTLRDSRLSESSRAAARPNTSRRSPSRRNERSPKARRNSSSTKAMVFRRRTNSTTRRRSSTRSGVM